MAKMREGVVERIGIWPEEHCFHLFSCVGSKLENRPCATLVGAKSAQEGTYRATFADCHLAALSVHARVGQQTKVKLV